MKMRMEMKMEMKNLDIVMTVMIGAFLVYFLSRGNSKFLKKKEKEKEI